MTYNEKKSLYESIMKDVAKAVKRKLNESTKGSSYSDGWKDAMDDIKLGKFNIDTVEDYKRGYNDAIETWLKEMGERNNVFS